MRRLPVFLAATVLALALSLCASPSAPSGSVLFALISGNHQTVEAGSDSLLEPVVGQAYRDKNGSVAFRVLGAQPLAAQTQINTGVANILTCSSPVGNAGLVAYVQCATTDANGMVTYWYQPGTVATDSACAQIRATPNNQPTVLAETCSVVAPGPMVAFHAAKPDTMSQYVTPGDTLDLRPFISGALDQYNNQISLDSIRAYPNASVGWAWFDFSGSSEATTPTGSGWTTAVPDAAALGWGKSYDGNYRIGLVIWINGLHMGNQTSAIPLEIIP